MLLLWVALAALGIILLSIAPVMPTARAGLMITAVLVSAIAVPGSVIILVGVLVGGAIVADAWMARATPAAVRAVPNLLVRGQAARISIAIADAPPGTTRVRQPRAEEVHVSPPEGDGGLTAAVTADRRGRHELQPVALRVTGPLRLAAWYRRVGEAAELVVYPDVPNARRIATAVRRGLFRDSGEITRGPLGLGTDFESIRDYLPDDDIRQVNWPATQRQGRPMSNQYRVEQDRIVIGLVDSGRLMGAPIGDRTRLDAALDALTAVAYVADEVGDRSGVVAFADTVRRRAKPNRRGADGIVRAIFDLEPAPVDAAYELAFRSVGGGKRALVMVFTDLLDGAAASELLRAVPVLARRHAVVVVSAIDPDLDSYRRSRPETTADVYRTAATVDLLAHRRLVVHSLERAGATVVEALPGALSEACVRTYLRAKTRSRL